MISTRSPTLHALVSSCALNFFRTRKYFLYLGCLTRRSTITTTVVSDEQGQYRFPSTKLTSGQYALQIRSVGYDLDGPREVPEVDREQRMAIDVNTAAGYRT